ncbi:hypothetical protein BJY04DRAFT_187158 [Aspergillus karnatakaensis]|uniref:uncharacterized protein n=1 Tax=Aspergillus karnatakaensis TaxID=1810916 RepID=UPI003CCDA3DF
MLRGQQRYPGIIPGHAFASTGESSSCTTRYRLLPLPYAGDPSGERSASLPCALTVARHRSHCGFVVEPRGGGCLTHDKALTQRGLYTRADSSTG